YYREHKLDHTEVYQGVPEALTAMRFTRNGAGTAPRGAVERSMAVLSNKPVVPSRQIVQALGLAGFFVQVYGGNSFSTKKPDPLGAHSLLEEVGVKSDEAVIIG